MLNDSIILYPSNWLYNAGVVGLLDVKENAGEEVEESLFADGSYHLSTDYFDALNVGTQELSKAIVFLTNRLVSDSELENWLYDGQGNGVEQKQKRKPKTESKPKRDKLSKYQKFKEELGEFGYRFIRTGNKLFASKTPYQNLVQLSEWQSYEFPKLVREIPTLSKSPNKQMCDLCRDNPIVVTDQESKLQTRLIRLQSTHLKGLGPSLGEFPNGFWNLNQSLKICHLCSFLLIHHHLAFIRTSDGSDIFINGPSFRVIYQLNKLARELYSNGSAEEQRSRRSILAMSVIEYALKTKTSLGVWTGMNIEVITKRGNQVEYFSLPYHVIKLISNRQISALLSDIGEFRILNLVINEEYSKLTEVGYRLLRESISDRRNYDYINTWLYLDRNKRNLSETANKLFKLYATIEQRRRNLYAY